MKWATVTWSMAASAYLTLAVVHALVWSKRRTAWADLLFSVTAASAAAYTLCELRVTWAQTPAEIAAAIRWAHVPVWMLLVGLTWFMRLYLRAGWAPLAWSFVVLRTLSLLPNFLTGQNLNYRSITAVEHVTFLGESVSVPVGEPNPWMIIAQLSSLVFVLFAADASFRLWQRGDRRKAVLAGCMVFFVLGGALQSMLVFWGFVTQPIMIGLFYSGIVAAMGYEMSRDVLRASQLVQELQESEERLNGLRHELAHVGRVSMMGQLASSLAHEINQPLGAILRNAEAAELFMQRESPDVGEVREILADIRKDNQRAGAVIDRMRALLKRHNLETRPLDVGELVRDVAALVRTDAAARHVKLNADMPTGLPLVNGDRVHVQQVLLNLILNAMDALKTGGLQNQRVSVTARCDGARSVEIAVSDTGHGIPADALKRIFDPFVTTKPTGMGMGLSISHTIVEAHGGRLWAENNEEGGATFRFTLPVTEVA